jgi:hypothetical protein
LIASGISAAMLATFVGPPVETAVVAVEPPHAVSVIATATRIIGNRFTCSSPVGLRKPEMKTLREL